MAENNTNSEKIVSKGELFDENGKFKVGHPKVGGKEKGTRDFATDFDEVVEEIAEENGITKSQARKHLLKVAYKEAKNGNYNFYKDIHDRVYGQAKSKHEITGADGKDLFPDPATRERTDKALDVYLNK